MREMAPFWAGAQDHGGRVDWQRLEDVVGGRDRLALARQEDLVAVGVEAARAKAWMASGPRRTTGEVLTWADQAYPDALRKMNQPPPVLCVEGDVAALQGRGVAVVGSRTCTTYGRSVARRLGAALAQAGRVVVSGLARGIDGEAHVGALSCGRTVAVLGHGLAHTAPSCHRRLRERIARESGALVSVWPDDMPPRPHTFPLRNAWISGLSEAVVVVEAGETSGALITARLALADGRDVFAVPGQIDAPSAVGCLRLLDEGAGVVTDVAAFVQRLTGLGAPTVEGWLDMLGRGCTIDEVSRRTGRPVTALLGELTRLELAGKVARVQGQRFLPLGAAVERAE